MNPKSIISSWRPKERPVLIHTVIGVLVGYFFLHPITMVIYWLQSNDSNISVHSILDAIDKAFLHAFYLHMMPMSIAFIILGGIIGLLSGISFRKIRKQGRKIRMQQIQLNESFKKLETLNKSLEDKVIERTRELEDSNEKLLTLNLKLLDLDKAKGEFLNLISHEIRTPLNGIIGPLELLKEHVSSHDIGDLVVVLDTSVKRLEKFALDALLITRLKIKPIDIKKDKIFLSNIINEILDGDTEKIQTRNIHIKKNDRIAPGLISGEAYLIKKCIDNIIDNAIISSPKDGIVEITTYADEHTFVCEIKDNGKGFPTDTLDRVFDLFNPGEEYKDNSTGLSLSIVKMIMEAHGGNVLIGNNNEGGASVKLFFPV